MESLKSGSQNYQKGMGFELSNSKEFQLHTEPIWTICLLEDERIATGSEDKLIKIFNVKVGQCEITIEAHTCGITNLSLLKNGHLVSSSKDMKIKIWEITKNNYQLIKTLNEHRGYVFKTIEISCNRIVSCSNDCTLKFWKNSVPYNCIKTVSTERGAAYFQLLEMKNKKQIISGNSEEISFWNSSTYALEKTIKHNLHIPHLFDAITLIEIKDSKILIGGTYCVIVLNTKTFQVESTIKNGIFKIIRYFFPINDDCVLCQGMSGIFEKNECSFAKLELSTLTIIDSIKQNFTFASLVLNLNNWEIALGDKKGYLKTVKIFHE